MTLGLDYFSKLGVGVSDELRYLFRHASGSARFYYFKYRKNNERIRRDGRATITWRPSHKQTLPFLNSRLLLNVNRQSRPGFLRLLDNSFDGARHANFQTSLTPDLVFRQHRVFRSAPRTRKPTIRCQQIDADRGIPAVAVFQPEPAEAGQAARAIFPWASDFSRVAPQRTVTFEETSRIRDRFPFPAPDRHPFLSSCPCSSSPG